MLTDITMKSTMQNKLDNFSQKASEVNQKLWEIEDQIRVLERKNNSIKILSFSKKCIY